MKTKLWIIFSCISEYAEVGAYPEFNTKLGAHGYATALMRKENHLLFDYRVYDVYPSLTEKQNYIAILRTDIFRKYKAIGRRVDEKLVDTIADMSILELEELDSALETGIKEAILI